MRYFVDSNGSIRFIDNYGWTDFPGGVRVNEQEMTVYTIDEDEMVTGEYNLWSSLTALAKAIES